MEENSLSYGHSERQEAGPGEKPPGVSTLLPSQLAWLQTFLPLTFPPSSIQGTHNAYWPAHFKWVNWWGWAFLGKLPFLADCFSKQETEFKVLETLMFLTHNQFFQWVQKLTFIHNKYPNPFKASNSTCKNVFSSFFTRFPGSILEHSFPPPPPIDKIL